MQAWQDSIETGNRCFGERDYATAQRHYRRALLQARALFACWPNADAATAALVVSHFNLADLHVALGQYEAAAETLCAAHRHLLRSCDDPALADACRHAAACHSGKTYAELLSFIGTYGEYPCITRLLADQAAPRWPQPAAGADALHPSPSGDI